MGHQAVVIINKGSLTDWRIRRIILVELFIRMSSSSFRFLKMLSCEFENAEFFWLRSARHSNGIFLKTSRIKPIQPK